MIWLQTAGVLSIHPKTRLTLKAEASCVRLATAYVVLSAAGRPCTPACTPAPVNVLFNTGMGRILQSRGMPKHADETSGFSPWRYQ